MAATKPKYQVVENNLHITLESGEKPTEIVVPLRFKAGLYRRVASSGDGVLQFATVLDGLGLGKELTAYDDVDLEEADEVSTRYFAALADLLGAQPGK